MSGGPTPHGQEQVPDAHGSSPPGAHGSDPPAFDGAAAPSRPPDDTDPHGRDDHGQPDAGRLFALPDDGGGRGPDDGAEGPSG